MPTTEPRRVHDQHDQSPRLRSYVTLIRNSLRSVKTSTPQKPVPKSREDIRGPLGLTTLFEPHESRADLVFVHGLGGGSRKTWSSLEQSIFWPEEWLPTDPGFKHVRIHTYGYNSDWTKSLQSDLTIHDFGQALLADLYNSLQLRDPGNTPIIMIAHSMGGLVVKRAYLLATRDPIYSSIAARIRSIHFLATPHRGADSAQLLTRVLSTSVSHGPKAYVNELWPGSGTLQAINDEFRHVCHNLNLWSFFETIPTTAGPISVTIVDKESAVIGLPGEHVQYLEANHRNICKFKSPNDANYIILRRCLLNTLQQIETSSRDNEHKPQMTLVSELLNIKYRPESDLLSVTEKQHRGSCAWIIKSDIFQEWTNIKSSYKPDSFTEKRDTGTRSLWLNGPPGSGKSVAAGHVIRFLEGRNFGCSFFFFNFRDMKRSSLSEMLRSLAFQMASSNHAIRAILAKMAVDEKALLLDDHNIIWNTIFKNAIFRAEFPQPQFWVIDALDECSSGSLRTLVQMLARIDLGIPLRIFFTSRPDLQIKSLFDQHDTTVPELHTGSEGSSLDIVSYVQDNLIYSEEPAVIDWLIAEVLKKSNGVFLWASLMVDRLNEAYSLEDMQEILKQVPSEMNEFYMRIVQSISESPSADLAKCILKWVACAARPLSTEELRDAVRADIKKTLTTSNDKLIRVCGNLITIDKDSRVQLIHQTVTAFLTEERPSFWIDQSVSHSRIAEICLVNLNDEDFTPPRSRRVASSRGAKSVLSDYACTYFSYHLSHGSLESETPLCLLSSFFRANFLTWIEKVAEKGNLATLTEAVQNLHLYLSQREKSKPPTEGSLQLVRCLVNDIARIITAFGPSLLDAPSSIHFLIPPLCPPASNIHRLFVKPSRLLKLTGSSGEDWDDRISCLRYSTDVLSVATNPQYLAVGLKDGNINIYNDVTLELTATITHGEPVRLLCFGSVSSVLASCGPRKVTLWDHRRAPMWSHSLEAVPLEICFSSDDDDLYIPRRDSTVSVFDAKYGKRIDEIPLNYTSDSDSDEENLIIPGTPPSVVRISPIYGLAAIAYRNFPITVWDLERGNRVGVFEKEGCENVYVSPQVLDIVFNPVPELDLMAVAYNDGDLIACNPWRLEQRLVYRGILCHILAASPDGRTLATGDATGAVHLLSFETLRLLYKVAAIEDCVMNIIFASNSLRFFDIRDSCCNVWEPPVLRQRDMADDISSEPQGGEMAPTMLPTTFTRLIKDDEEITVIEHTPDADVVFCGRENGAITIHERSTGVLIEQFRFHARMISIRDIKWNSKRRVLVSVDSASRCIATQFPLELDREWKQAERVFDCRIGEAISQLLISPDGLRILLRTFNTSELWDIDKGLIASVKTPDSATWATHPTKEDLLIQFQVDSLKIFTWAGLVETSMNGGIPMTGHAVFNNMIDGTWVTRPGYSLLTWIGRLEGDEAGFMTLEAAMIDSNATQIEVTFTPRKLHANIKVLIGLFKSSLFFLDTRGWVCSIGVKAISDAKFYTRHFFIPLTWQTASELVIKAISKNSVAFAHQDQLKIFHGFLDFEEKVYFAT